MKNRLAIVGAGDLGQLIAYHAVSDRHYTVVGFFDDYADNKESVVGFPVLGVTNDVEQAYVHGYFDFIMIGVGYKHFSFRKELYERYLAKIPFGTIVHSSAHVEASACVGAGSFLLPGVLVDSKVNIGDNVLLNVGAIVSHDTTVRNHSFVGPGAVLAGKSVIGECCMVGVGATIIDNLSIADSTIIGGGAVVVNHITKSGVYTGVPAKALIKKTK